jgi:hypothetical protein
MNILDKSDFDLIFIGNVFGCLGLLGCFCFCLGLVGLQRFGLVGSTGSVAISHSVLFESLESARPVFQFGEWRRQGDD